MSDGNYLSLTIFLLSFKPLSSPYHITYLRKRLEFRALRIRCVMIKHFHALRFKRIYMGLGRFLLITLQPCKQAT